MEDYPNYIKEPVRPLVFLFGQIENEVELHKKMIKSLETSFTSNLIDVAAFTSSPFASFFLQKGPSYKSITDSYSFPIKKISKDINNLNSFTMDGILKYNWMKKYCSLIPSVVLFFLSYPSDINLPDWHRKVSLYHEMYTKLKNNLAGRETKIILIVVKVEGNGSSSSGSSSVGASSSSSSIPSSPLPASHANSLLSSPATPSISTLMTPINSPQQVQSDSIEDRLNYLKKHLNIENKNFFFFFFPSEIVTEINTIKKIIKIIKENSVNYYNNIIKKLKNYNKMLIEKIKNNHHFSSNSTSTNNNANLINDLALNSSINVSTLYSILTIRYNFKIALLSEFQSNYEIAMKHYMITYNELLHNMENLRDIYDQIREISELLNYKIIFYTIFKENVTSFLPSETKNTTSSNLYLTSLPSSNIFKQFNQFISSFYLLEDVFPSRHFNWIARQYLIILGLLENFQGRSSNGSLPPANAIIPSSYYLQYPYLDPSYYYQNSARYISLSEEALRQFELKNSNTVAEVEKIVKENQSNEFFLGMKISSPKYIGSPFIIENHDDQSSLFDNTILLSKTYMQYLYYKESLIPHSDLVLHYLNLAILKLPEDLSKNGSLLNSYLSNFQTMSPSSYLSLNSFQSISFPSISLPISSKISRKKSIFYGLISSQYMKRKDYRLAYEFLLPLSINLISEGWLSFPIKKYNSASPSIGTSILFDLIRCCIHLGKVDDFLKFSLLLISSQYLNLVQLNDAKMKGLEESKVKVKEDVKDVKNPHDYRDSEGERDRGSSSYVSYLNSSNITSRSLYLGGHSDSYKEINKKIRDSNLDFQEKIKDSVYLSSFHGELDDESIQKLFDLIMMFFSLKKTCEKDLKKIFLQYLNNDFNEFNSFNKKNEIASLEVNSLSHYTPFQLEYLDANHKLFDFSLTYSQPTIVIGEKLGFKMIIRSFFPKSITFDKLRLIFFEDSLTFSLLNLEDDSKNNREASKIKTFNIENHSFFSTSLTFLPFETVTINFSIEVTEDIFSKVLQYDSVLLLKKYEFVYNKDEDEKFTHETIEDKAVSINNLEEVAVVTSIVIPQQLISILSRNSKNPIKIKDVLSFCPYYLPHVVISRPVDLIKLVYPPPPTSTSQQSISLLSGILQRVDLEFEVGEHDLSDTCITLNTNYYSSYSSIIPVADRMPLLWSPVSESLKQIEESFEGKNIKDLELEFDNVKFYPLKTTKKDSQSSTSTSITSTNPLKLDKILKKNGKFYFSLFFYIQDIKYYTNLTSISFSFSVSLSFIPRKIMNSPIHKEFFINIEGLSPLVLTYKLSSLENASQYLSFNNNGTSQSSTNSSFLSNSSPSIILGTRNILSFTTRCLNALKSEIEIIDWLINPNSEKEKLENGKLIPLISNSFSSPIVPSQINSTLKAHEELQTNIVFKWEREAEKENLNSVSTSNLNNLLLETPEQHIITSPYLSSLGKLSLRWRMVYNHPLKFNNTNILDSSYFSSIYFPNDNIKDWIELDEISSTLPLPTLTSIASSSFTIPNVEIQDLPFLVEIKTPSKSKLGEEITIKINISNIKNIQLKLFLVVLLSDNFLISGRNSSFIDLLPYSAYPPSEKKKKNDFNSSGKLIRKEVITFKAIPLKTGWLPLPRFLIHSEISSQLSGLNLPNIGGGLLKFFDTGEKESERQSIFIYP